MEGERFTLTLRRLGDYRIEVDFGMDGVPPLLLDEGPPLGGSDGPNPARTLAAAIGGCLAASLLFCLGKARIPVEDLTVRVEGEYRRNPAGRLRIPGFSVTLEPVIADDDTARMARCLDVFEDFCIVTQSVREGMNIDVRVQPGGVSAAAP
jgi:uncharacterized OsmC-like protein